MNCQNLDIEANKADFHPALWGTIIGSGKAYFHSAPTAECKEKTFIIKGDHFSIYTASPSSNPIKWLYVMYQNTKAKKAEEEFIYGWIPADRIKIGGHYGGQ